MSTPHKHAALIKAWADDQSLEIRFKRGDGIWLNTGTPSWCLHYEYRIKPPIKKVRIALFSCEGHDWFNPCQDDSTAERYTHARYFVRWLTDWIEYGE